MSDVNSTFLQLLDLMTSPMLSGDGFHWVIDGVRMTAAGPQARFTFDWHYTRRGDVPTSSHDSFSCMTLQREGGKYALRAETCTLGKMTTDSMHALENRFMKAVHAMRER